VPVDLTSEPFDVEEARRHGVTRRQLMGPRWRRLGYKVYASSDIADDPFVRLRAAMCRLPEAAVFSGPTAAWLHRLDQTSTVIEATIPSPTQISRRARITIRRRRLAPDEVVIRKGLRVTSPLRTVTDLASRLDLVEAVVVLDTALHKKLIRLDQVPLHGEYVEPASESPMETRLRMLLVLAGLPRPKAQISLHDDHGWFLGRADLYYPERRLVIEYDGATHRDSLAAGQPAPEPADRRRLSRPTLQRFGRAGYS
jgi:hypothetical protein